MIEKLKTCFIVLLVVLAVVGGCLLQYKDVNAGEVRLTQEQQTINIFNRLKHRLPSEYWDIRLIFFKEFNAEATDGVVYFGRPLLRYPDDVKALVLGHELGHEVLGHMVMVNKNTFHEEQDADGFGLMLSTLIGYEPHQTLKDAKVLFSTFRGNKEHGTPTVRLQRMDNQQQYLDTYRDKVFVAIFVASVLLRALIS